MSGTCVPKLGQIGTRFDTIRQWVPRVRSWLCRGFAPFLDLVESVEQPGGILRWPPVDFAPCAESAISVAFPLVP